MSDVFCVCSNSHPYPHSQKRLLPVPLKVPRFTNQYLTSNIHLKIRWPFSERECHMFLANLMLQVFYISLYISHIWTNKCRTYFCIIHNWIVLPFSNLSAWCEPGCTDEWRWVPSTHTLSPCPRLTLAILNSTPGPYRHPTTKYEISSFLFEKLTTV